MAVMLMRYAKYKGKDVSRSADLSDYHDSEEISNWAIEAMSWANACGFINGMSESRINPKGTASRAQVAVVIHRFMH